MASLAGFGKLGTLALALLLVAAAGCQRDVVLPGGPGSDGGGLGGGVDARVGQTGTISIDLSPRPPKLDVLFLVGNSSNTDAMHRQLPGQFAQFLQPLQDLAAKGIYADVNLGVVTSDYGAGITGAPGCTPSSPQGGGDQGGLQGIGKQAAPQCLKPIGTNFVHFVFGPNGLARSNLPPHQSLLDTFTCMTSVGSRGCGFEHQLEAVYAALHNNIPDNQGSLADPGFLRDDARLAVVFLTRKDDGSAPYDTDVFDKSKVAQYGYEDTYSRQTRFAVVCGSPPAFPPYGDSNGPLGNCQAAPNNGGDGIQGKQYDITRYINFFTSPAINGGVKSNPLDVALVAIDAPEAPFQVILSNPGTPAGSPYLRCGMLNEQSNPPCVPVLQHSCMNPNNPVLFGDPAVRLNAVVRAAWNHQVSSICDADYGPALTAAAQLLAVRFPTCATFELPVDGAGHVVADCQVVETVRHGDGSFTETSIPECAPGHPVVPCWTLDRVEACASQSPNSVGFTFDFGGAQPPAPAFATMTCRTQ